MCQGRSNNNPGTINIRLYTDIPVEIYVNTVHILINVTTREVLVISGWRILHYSVVPALTMTKIVTISTKIENDSFLFYKHMKHDIEIKIVKE